MAFKFKYMLNGAANPTIIDWPVAASQTINIGDTLQLSSGLAAVGAAAQADFIGVAATAITTGSTVTDAQTVKVIIPIDAVFEADYTGSTLPDPTSANLGTAFDLGASSASQIDLDDTTGGAWVFIDLPHLDTANNKMYVTCLRSKTIFN